MIRPRAQAWNGLGDAYAGAVATFVLVHGAWLGGWCWRDVRHLLTARGHEVYTPTLTGLGDRAHLLSAASLTTHVEDVRALLDAEDLHDVHLVLHGYAGLLSHGIPGSRVKSIIYLGGYLAHPGESWLDVLPPSTAAEYDLAAIGGRLRPPPHLLDEWGVTDPANCDWLMPRLSDFPAQCLTEPASNASPGVRRAYVRHTQPSVPGLDLAWERALTAGFETAEVSCGHAMMVSAPRQTARLLEALGPQDALPPVFPASPRIALW